MGQETIAATFLLSTLILVCIRYALNVPPFLRQIHIFLHWLMIHFLLNIENSAPHIAYARLGFCCKLEYHEKKTNSNFQRKGQKISFMKAWKVDRALLSQMA